MKPSYNFEGFFFVLEGGREERNDMLNGGGAFCFSSERPPSFPMVYILSRRPFVS